MTIPLAGSRPGPRAGRLLAIVAATALSLTACSSVGSDGSSGSKASGDSVGSTATGVKNGGTLTIALSAEPDFLDPTLAGSLYSRYIFNAMCEKLYDLNKDVRIVPQLAKSLPETSADGKTVTIPLRTGIKFADGTPFNAEAVKTSLERDLTNPQSARVSELGPIASVEATDATTVTIHLKTPFAPLTAALADRSGMVMSPKQLKAKGDDFGQAPVCVGPFKFAKRVPQNSIDLVKDPNYYDAKKVHLDRIVYRIITDSGIRSANLKSGDAQVADTLSTNDVPSLKQETKLSVLESPSLGYQGVTFNVGNAAGVGKPTKTLDQPYAKDPRIRQAFEYAVDRKALVDNVFDGLFETACGPVAPQSEFSTDAVQQCRAADPAKAKSLLKAAGVKTPYTLTLLATNTPDSLQLAQALQAMVKPSGFNLKIEPVEFTALLDQQDAGKFQMLQLGWSGRVDPDANTTNFVGTGGSQNVAGYTNPAVDKLLDQARQSQSVDERAAIYGQLQKKLQQDDPLIYLYRQRNLTGVSKTVSGVQVYADGLIRAAFAGYRK
ncbi:MAG: peptide/nickel transport system substrate-binding protein [Nocardioidaceae bacterium]|nr:peptide/nickel transport system substrate-binding protein [Nocardioidaceae bacterium]